MSTLFDSLFRRNHHNYQLPKNADIPPQSKVGVTATPPITTSPSDTSESKQANNGGSNGFLSIKFLYQNPIGRQLTKERLGRAKYAGIWYAKDDPHLDRDPQLEEYITSIPNALRYRGLLLQGYLVYAKVLRAIEAFEVRPDDVWLITYPKSGTTWTEEILSLIRAKGDVKAVGKKLIHERVPHLEVGKPLGHVRWLKNLPGPRLLATHLPLEYIPAQLRATKAKIIYVVRNPKDNAVSYFHHHRMSTFLGNYSGTFANFLQLFAKGHLVYGDWFDHVAGYWELFQRRPDQVLFISYEELKTNLPAMIRLISDFIGHPLDAETIATIAQQCSFESMKSNTMVNREALPIGDLFDMSKSKFMRKGIIGDWRNHFTPEESATFDALYADRLKALGLQLVYDAEEAEEAIRTNGGRIIRHLSEQPPREPVPPKVAPLVVNKTATTAVTNGSGHYS